MWLSDRRAVLSLLALVTLAGCGYTPAYAPGTAASALFGRIEVRAPGSEDEFELVTRIEERLGRTSDPAFDLSYSIATSEIDLAITQVNEITRYNVEGSVTYKLTNRATGQTESTDRLNGFTSYAATGTTVATDAARTDARRRLMRLLADQIVTRVLADTASR